MLVRLGVEATVVMDRLLEMGLLVDDGPGALKRAIKSIRDVALRKRWLVVMGRLGERLQRPTHGLNSTPVTIQSLRLATIDVALLSESGAATCELPSSKGCYSPGSDLPEIVRFDCLALSSSFGDIARRRQTAIEKGEETEIVWKDRFGLFAEVYSTLIVVDRYAGSTCKTKGRWSGLSRLLSRLRGTKAYDGLKVYTSARSHQHAVQVQEALMAMRDASGLRPDDVVISPDEVFRDYAHERYLRFRDQVIVLDTGLDIFEGDRVPRRCGFRVHRQVRSVRAVEKRLRDARFQL